MYHFISVPCWVTTSKLSSLKQSHYIPCLCENLNRTQLEFLNVLLSNDCNHPVSSGRQGGWLLEEGRKAELSWKC